MFSNSFKSNIDTDFLNSLPVMAFSGTITIVNTLEEADIAVKELEKCDILGFDTETRPNFKKGSSHKVALLQLASGNTAFLFRLHHSGINELLVQLLENKLIRKIGAAIHDDLKALLKIKKFTPGGFIDLQDLVSDYGIKEKGVRKLAGVVLEKRISKSQQLSNWEAPLLNEGQQIYAATDAWVCREIYLKLLSTKPSP